MLKIIIDGPPIVQQRHRVSKYSGMFDPSGPAKEVLGKTLLVGRQLGKMQMLEVECSVEAHFFDGPRLRGQKPDIDNFLKALFDAANGIIWKDDSQVVALIASIKRNAAAPRTELIVHPA